MYMLIVYANRNSQEKTTANQQLTFTKRWPQLFVRWRERREQCRRGSSNFKMICTVCQIYYKYETSEEMVAHEETCDGKLDIHTTRWLPKGPSNASSAYFHLRPFYDAMVKHKDELDKLGKGLDHVDLCVETAVRSSLSKFRRASKRLITLNSLSH